MKKTLLIFSLIFASSINAFSNDELPKKIVIGFIPSGNPETIKSESFDLAQEVEKRVHVPVEVYISKDYSDLVLAMKDKKTDFAFFSALTFVQAEKQTQVKVLLKKTWEQPYYYATVVSRLDSGIKTLHQLKNKKIAFVDQNSSSGYLYPMVWLKKNKFEIKNFKEVIYSGNHQESVRLLENKKVDAIATFTDDEKLKIGSWTRFGTGNLKVNKIWISDEIPNDPFCVRQDFYDRYPKLTHDLMFQLIDINDQAQLNKKYKNILGSQGLIPATSRQYDPVREMVQTLFQ